MNLYDLEQIAIRDDWDKSDADCALEHLAELLAVARAAEAVLKSCAGGSTGMSSCYLEALREALKPLQTEVD